MTELEFELEFKKRKLQKRKQRRMELLIIGAHLGVVLVLLYWMFGIGMVHGRSMRPAYRDGDLFLYQRRLFREPDYGDVAVPYRDDWITFPYTVPEGCYFCLGDNRPRSEDSRELGAFRRREITGKVLAQFRLSSVK